MVAGDENRRRSTFVPVELLISHSIAAEASSTITGRLAPRERHRRPTPANSRERDVPGAPSIRLSWDAPQPGGFQQLNSPTAASLTKLLWPSVQSVRHISKLDHAWHVSSMNTC